MTYNVPDNMRGTMINKGEKHILNIELKILDKKCILKWFVTKALNTNGLNVYEWMNK